MVGKKVKSVLSFVAWITGVIVSLAVGFAMIDGVLYIRWIPEVVTIVAGWVVVLTTVLSAVLAILKK
jgi:hypothetical protein